jgi:hypothetical protein
MVRYARRAGDWLAVLSGDHIVSLEGAGWHEIVEQFGGGIFGPDVGAVLFSGVKCALGVGHDAPRPPGSHPLALMN